MGPNSKRAQAAGAAARNVPSRARFSKGPPKKGGRGGRGGGRGGGGGRGRGRGRGEGEDGGKDRDDGRGGGRGRGRGRGGRGNRSGGGDKVKQSVVDKIAQNVQRKKKTAGLSQSTSHMVTTSKNSSMKKKLRDPFDGIDITKFDQVTLSEESVQIVVELLTKLKVMEDNSLVDHSEAGTGKDKNDLDISNSGTRRSKGPKANKMSTLEKEFVPTFNHVLDDSNDNYRKTDNLSSNKHEKLRSNGSRQGTANNIAGGGVGGGYNECDEEDFVGLDSAEWAEQQILINGESDTEIDDIIVDSNGTKQNNQTFSTNKEKENDDNLFNSGSKHSIPIIEKDLVKIEEKKDDVENMFIKKPLYIHLTSVLSFSENNAERACLALQSWDAAGVNNSTVTETIEELDSDELALAMDWLCLHLSNEDLKNGFKLRPKSKKNPLKGLSKSTGFSKATGLKHVGTPIPHSSISLVKPQSEEEWRIDHDKASRGLGYVRLGFHHDESDMAVDLTGPYKYAVAPEEDDASLRILLSLLENKTVKKIDDNSNGYELNEMKMTSADLDFARIERKEELDALQAIFDDDFQVITPKLNQGGSRLDSSGPNVDECHYKININNISTLNSASHIQGCKLHIFTRPSYPIMSSPLLLFTNPILPPTLLRYIHIALMQRAHQMEGEAVIYSLVEYISDLVPQLHDNFVKEQRAKEFEAEQKRIREKAGHVDVQHIIDAQYENDGKIGKRQRAKLRAAQKSYERVSKTDAEAKEYEQRKDVRIARAQESQKNVRFTRAEQFLKKREMEQIMEESEKTARSAMTAAFLRGCNVEEARDEAKKARSEVLKSHGIEQSIDNDSKDKNITKGTGLKDENSEDNDDDISKSDSDDSIKNEPIENPPASRVTLAFTDRLKEFYEAAARDKEKRKQTGENVDTNNECSNTRLVKPIIRGEVNDNMQEKRDNSKEEKKEETHIPEPVYMPCQALNKVMEDVVSAQKQQPWLLSGEARAITKDKDPSLINCDINLSKSQIKERESISKSLKKELEQKHKYADEWRKSNNSARCNSRSKNGRASSIGERFSKMLDQRTRLPACIMKEKIIKTIAENQITVISGDTGCGKTTQVPQLVLDSYIENVRGSEANMIITQPRRISAIGVAERVASERCERVGETAGYSIRLENKRSSKTRLLLCTTGILLRRLQVDPDLASVSHIFVDEVHERDLNTDFLLIILKDLLIRRKSLKLVLMSATLNADTFSNYFFQCPTVTIPGRAHPVQEFRLEDVLQITGHEIEEGSDYALKKNSKNKSKYTKSNLKRLYHPKYQAHVINSLSIVDESVINYELIGKLLEKLTENNEEGAILVFMPGFQEITKLVEELYKTEFFTDPSRVRVYPLHSSLSTSEQTAVFDVPPEGIRKIVVSTNIAETSITIEDVVFVIDCGRVKENRQDEIAQMQTLVECWVSRASAKQRRGRAGRVRPGIAYHMYSSHTNNDTLEEYQLPEMLRVGLEDLVLQVLLLDLGEPSIFLTKAVNPPSALAIKNSLQILEGLGAIECEWGDNVQMNTISQDNKSDSCEVLEVGSGMTALGFHLATLPVDPRVGKMMIYGALFGCTDSALTIAAAMSARSPFMTPFDKRDLADAARKKFATEGSDHLTTLTAFNQWRDLRQNQNGQVNSFLRESFLSRLTLHQMEDLRKQFSDLLKDIGFLPRSYHCISGNRRQPVRRHGTSIPASEVKAVAEANAKSGNVQLVKAILCAGLYPNIIVAPRDLVGSKKCGKAVGECAFYSKKGDVYLHPSTISFTEKSLESRYCCYHEIIKTSKIYVRDCTTVSEFALLLFGGNLKVHHTKNVVTIDNWINFRIGAKPATLVKHLRAQMETLLLKKIVSPDLDVTGSLEGKALIEAVSTLVEKEVKEAPDRAAAEIVKPWTEERAKTSSKESTFRGNRRGQGNTTRTNGDRVHRK